MGRRDSEAEVFEHALRAASPNIALREDELRALYGAKPWILAAAQAYRQNYFERRPSQLLGPADEVVEHPKLWRWLFVVIAPPGILLMAALVVMLSPMRASAMDLGLFAIFALVVGLGVLAVSYAGRWGMTIARLWVFGSLVLSITLATTGTSGAFRWPSWAAAIAQIVLIAACTPLWRIGSIVLPSTSKMVKEEVAGQALEAWRTAVLRDGVQPVLRAERSSKQLVFGNVLRFADARGLYRGGSLISHQPVTAGWKLADLVNRLEGGTFALAGPRGAGKTSLLRAYCQGAYREPNQQLDLAVLVAAPVDYVPREFVLHLYAQTCRAVLAHVREVSPEDERRAGQADRPWRPRSPFDLVRLVRSARRGLDDIAFVQTRSGESSGKFGLRGAEFAYKRGVSLAGRPATFPEVVDDFRRFVRLAARELAPMRVLIAIDEMDRIGVGESARKFLNEIKAIFDVPGCYYLISVSTEAQHDFEQSGMGLRSVFDSSFDEVVRVDYLDFGFARSLINRSVEGLPQQFVALAYVFSGGLARQLTRSARAVVRQPQGKRLGAVVAELIADELERVRKSTGDALTSLQGGGRVTMLLRLLADPVYDLRAYRKAIQAAYDGENAAISDLRDRVAARVEFLAVAREMFTDEMAGVLVERVDALARARRYVGSNPATGLALLEEFSAAKPERPAPEQPPQ